MRNFTITNDPVEATWDWLDGVPDAPPPSPWRTFRPGPSRYWIDGVEVSYAEFVDEGEKYMAEQGKKHTCPKCGTQGEPFSGTVYRCPKCGWVTP